MTHTLPLGQSLLLLHFPEELLEELEELEDLEELEELDEELLEEFLALLLESGGRLQPNSSHPPSVLKIHAVPAQQVWTSTEKLTIFEGISIHAEIGLPKVLTNPVSNKVTISPPEDEELPLLLLELHFAHSSPPPPGLGLVDPLINNLSGIENVSNSNIL